LSIPTFTPRFTEKQGQYLAFIHTYILLHGCAPAEAEMQIFFRVSPPSVHRMIVELERRGLIHRKQRQARSIELRISADEIPPLLRQSIKTSGARY
jgi:Mn-dependent DtxR family transcriptional regulator